MATPAQISTDLRLWIGKLRGRHQQGEPLDPLCRSLNRAAALITDQRARIDALETEVRRLKGGRT